MDPVHGAQACPDRDVAVVGNAGRPHLDLTLDGGSFRDRTARVFVRDGVVYRGLSREAAGHWHRVRSELFFQRLSARQQIVGTRELTSDDVTRLDVSLSFAAVLQHERIPFVSYPFEWSFSMLRAAALLHLEILTEAVKVGVMLKDASPYNVQFRGTQPVFIDIGSFVTHASGEPWTGYRQFCEMMLFPLLLQAYRQIDIQPILRVKLDGISAKQFLRPLSWRDMFRPGVFTHGWLQSILDQRSGNIQTDTIGDLKSSGFSNQLIKNNLLQLTRLVSRLTWKPERTLWTNYRDALPHVVEDLSAKQQFVQQVCSTTRRKLVWDLGCNDGYFSRIAARHAETVVAMDQDHGCVERLYLRLAAENCDNILPLCIDLLNPSPALGWRGRERSRLEHRGLPELTICLGLIHHLVIAGNIPLPEVVDWLQSLGGEVVLEFPTKQDAMVRQLLKNKRDQYDDYSLENLERSLLQHFAIVGQAKLPSGERTLFHLVPKPSNGGSA